MQGHITKRGTNSYTVIINLGRDPLTGKRRQLWRSIKGTKKEAEALRIQLLHQRDSGVDAPPGNTNGRSIPGTMAERLRGAERSAQDFTHLRRHRAATPDTGLRFPTLV